MEMHAVEGRGHTCGDACGRVGGATHVEIHAVEWEGTHVRCMR